MAALLYRLGRFSARRAWLVIAGWLVALGLAGGALAAFGGSLAASFTIPGTATEQVTERLEAALPEFAGATATVVFRAEDGFDAAQRADIAALLDQVAALDGVVAVVDPFAAEAERAARASELVDGADRLDAAEAQLDLAAAGLPVDVLDAQREAISVQRGQLAIGERLLDAASGYRAVSDDGTTALGAVVFEEDSFALPAEVKTAVADRLDAAAIGGVSVDYSSEITASLDGLLGVGEVVGVLVAALVLVIMLRALLPALIPLVSSVIGVGVGIAASLAFSGAVDMTTVTPALGVMLGLAVGIDYSLFIINRHRRELRSGADLHEAIGRANGTAGSAVVFAGATVAVALVALLVTGIPFLGVMGIVAAFCVVVAVLAAVTLVPALLRLIGMRALDRRSRRGSVDAAPPRPMRTWRAVVAVVAGVAALLVVAAPALTMRLGLFDGSSEPVDSTQYRAYSAVADEFGPGRNGTLLVVADLDRPVSDAELPGVQARLADFLMAQDGVVAAVPVAAASGVLVFQAIPADGPTSESTEQLVHALRGAQPPPGFAELGVAGQASAAIDISEKLADALPVYLAIIVTIAVLLLIAVFRSLLVPLLAAAGFVLSLFAALGAVTAVYQWGWLGTVFGVHDPGPVLSFAPILIIGMLFGLAMDYQIFLVSGMREAYAHGAAPRFAVASGLRGARGVVTAAAIIMAAVFGGFVFSHLGMIRPLGFGLAVGVLFDAFVVRMLVMPAALHLLGRSAWWLPRWLERLLPRVDLEGTGLAGSVDAASRGSRSRAHDHRRRPGRIRAKAPASGP